MGKVGKGLEGCVGGAQKMTETVYWIYCDIDGTGKKWRFALEKDEDMFHFWREDFLEEMAVFRSCPFIKVKLEQPTEEYMEAILKESNKLPNEGC